MKKIIVDVMGADRPAAELVKGAVLAEKEYGASLVLVGDKNQIETAVAQNGGDAAKFTVVHTDSVITMEDDPMAIRRLKADSSMGTGLKMLAAGEGDAFVSTGNTGALFAGAYLFVRKIADVTSPAIASVIPSKNPVLLLDAGANIELTPDCLVQFGIMGKVFMKTIFGKENPRVGLLNNGAEKSKGTPLEVEAYKLLSDCPDINFVGNVEANKVVFGACDVLVTDGFTGNILLKSLEGMGKFMGQSLKDIFYKSFKSKMSYLMVKDGVSELKKSFDAGEHGGAPILGLSKPVIKAHGSSDARAFKNAIRQAISFADKDLTAKFADEFAAIKSRSTAPQD